jgi:hypothetical protein
MEALTDVEPEGPAGQAGRSARRLLRRARRGHPAVRAKRAGAGSPKVHRRLVALSHRLARRDT